MCSTCTCLHSNLFLPFFLNYKSFNLRDQNIYIHTYIYRKQLADHVEFYESSKAVINGAQFEVVLNGKVHGHTVGLRYQIIPPNEAYAWYSTSDQRVVREGIEEDVVIAHKVVAALRRNQKTRGQSPDEVIFYCRSSP